MQNFGLLVILTARDPRFVVKVTEEMIRHSRIRDILYFGAFAYSIAVLLFLLRSGVSARLRDVALRVTKRPFVASLIYVALLVLVQAALMLPIAFYGGFVLPHQFHTTDQSLPAWLVDELKGLGVTMVFGSVIGGLALLGIRKVRRWWLALSIGAIPLIILLVVIAPIVIDPIFNDFQPLRDQVLKQRLLDMASNAGIEGWRVYQVDKSKQTKTLNAYVTGLGPTKRIVMWDTLLAAMSRDEIVAVMGHEMGHYVLHHLWIGVTLTIIGTFFVLYLAQIAYERGVGKWGSRWRLTGTNDFAALPWLLLIVAVINFIGEPVSNGVSRYLEQQADVFSLEHTGLREPMATALVKLAENAKVNPRPNTFIEFWRYSHTSTDKRIDYVLNYRALSTKH